MYTCKSCGKNFEYPVIKEGNSRIKVMWILIICGFITCGLTWFMLPAALIKQPNIKQCPHCLAKI